MHIIKRSSTLACVHHIGYAMKGYTNPVRMPAGQQVNPIHPHPVNINSSQSSYRKNIQYTQEKSNTQT